MVIRTEPFRFADPVDFRGRSKLGSLPLCTCQAARVSFPMKVWCGRSILRDLGSISLSERGRTKRVEHRVLPEPSNRLEESRLLRRESIGVFQDPCRNDETDSVGSPIFIEVRRSCIHAIRP